MGPERSERPKQIWPLKLRKNIVICVSITPMQFGEWVGVNKSGNKETCEEAIAVVQAYEDGGLEKDEGGRPGW